MKRVKPTIHNGIWNASATVVTAITSIIGTYITTNAVLPAELGNYHYYMTLANVVAMLGMLSFPSALTKITAEMYGRTHHDEAHLLARCIIVVVMALNGLLVAGLLAANYLFAPDERIYLLIIALYLLPNALASLFRSVLWGKQRYKPVAITAIVGAIIQAMLLFVAARLQFGAAGFLAAMLIGTALQVIGLAGAMWHAQHKKSATSIPRWARPKRATITHYMAFFVPSVVVILYTQVVWERSEIFFLKWYVSDEQIAFYSIAYTLFTMLFMVGASLLHSFLPAFSYEYGAGNWAHIRRKAHQSMTIAMLYAVPLACGTIATVNGILLLLTNEQYQPVTLIARVLLIGLLPGTIGIVFGLMLTAAGGIWHSAWLGIAMMLVNLVLDVVLIPSYAALGGAIANSTTQCIHVAMMGILVYRIYGIGLPWRTLARVSAIGVGTTLVVPWLITQWLPSSSGTIVAIAVGGLLYGSIIWKQGFFTVLFTQKALQESSV